MKIDRLDHLVLTVANPILTCEFYTNILGMKTEQFANGRQALKYGNQKINLHQKGKEFEPKAQFPMPGSALGEMLSIYIRDPDGNLIEISNYL